MLLEANILSFYTNTLHPGLILEYLQHILYGILNVKNLYILLKILLFRLQNSIIKHIMDKKVYHLRRISDTSPGVLQPLERLIEGLAHFLKFMVLGTTVLLFF